MRRVVGTLLLLAALVGSGWWTPHSAAAVTSWGALDTELRALVASWPGHNAVSVSDLQTGQTISVNGDRPQLAACTIKIPIIMIVAQDIDAGRYSASEVADLVDAAMGPSSTWAARELLRYAGNGDIGVAIRRVNDLMRSLGATHSLLAHPPGYPDEDYGYDSGDNVLTTDDLNLMLAKLYRGEALSPGATQYALWSLTIAPEWMDESLGGPLPGDVTLYHKIGQLYAPQNTWNDAGLVVFSRGGRQYTYAISLLSSYTSSWRDGYAHAQAASAAAWHYFDAVYSAPAPPLPDSRYFPETGYWVAHGFLRYWETFGGLATFGYPISEEFTLNGLTVQYFQRARFEWHPASNPARYDVELGLLGDELTATRRAAGTGETPFQPVQASSDANCTFFPQTGHRLCFGFKDYWQTHGGLAVFGYPISEEFTEKRGDDAVLRAAAAGVASREPASLAGPRWAAPTASSRVAGREVVMCDTSRVIRHESSVMRDP